MLKIIKLLLRSLFASFKTKRELALENLALRHQLAVAHRTMKAHHKRPKLSDSDRKLWIFLSNQWEKWRSPLLLFKPDTVVSWHRKLFRGYWRRLSMRNSQGRPTIHPKIIALIKNISLANPTWGAPRIHGELLKLGIQICQSTVAKYMPPPSKRRPSGQSWKTFLKNHLKSVCSIDFLTVHTATFRILFLFVVFSHDRRRVLHFNSTYSPTSAWTAQQIRNAFPEDTAPKYLLRDRDSIFGKTFDQCVENMGIETLKTAPKSPWQNPYIERFWGSLRRDCLDHCIVLNQRHLHRLVSEYVDYYHKSRTHLGLEKDTPEPRPIEPASLGTVRAKPVLGGLHHRYFRRAA